MYRSGVKRVAHHNFQFQIAAAFALCVALCVALLARGAHAQESAPVTIDTSPTAAELLRRAQESAVNNPTESARSLQEAVDRFPNKLVPWDGSSERFQNTLDAAERFLLSNALVMQSWLREESAAAQRRLDQGEVLQVAQLRSLTPAGLQAMMTLAQQSLDQGRVDSAHRWIEKALRHPSLTPEQKILLEKAALDIDNFKANFKASFSITPAPQKNDIATAADKVVDIAQWRPLWSEWIAETWLNRHFVQVDPQSHVREQQESAINGSALLSTARFTADGLLIADGVTVRLLDLQTGLRRWQETVGSPSDRATLAPSDLAVAACADDVVVTLPGHALSEERSGLAKITALSLRTGVRLWDVYLDRLARTDAFAELFPHGEPLIVNDVVVVQARKSNSRLESAAWLIALDRDTGALRWANSLGAAGGVRLAVSRPLSSPTQLNGDVIAATSLGVVARMDSSNGHVIWLRRWSAPLREPRAANPPWQLPSPVVANDCVFWIQPDQSTLVCLSAQDGSTKWSTLLGVNEQLPAARSLLADQSRIYLLGEDVVAIDINDPRHTLWKLSDQLSERNPVRGECALGADQNGQPLLAVPLTNKVLLLDPATGRALGECPLQAGGNLSLQNGQLAIVDAQRVSLSMQATQGERLLRDRLAKNPSDPRNGLALLEFGRTLGKSPLMLDGATAMSSAINQTSTSSNINANTGALRDELLRRLLDVLGMKDMDQDTRAQLLAIANSTAISAAHHATIALRIGDLAAQQGQFDVAMDQWCSILESKAMRDEMVGEDPRRTSAKVAALESVLSHPQTSNMPSRQRVARQARAEMLKCDSLSFINAVNMAVLISSNAGDAKNILQEAAQRARDMGWMEAQRICLSMNSNEPSGARWPHANMSERLPQLGSAQSRGTTFAGRLLTMDPQAQAERPRSTMLFAEPSNILLRGGNDLGIVWRSAFGDRDPMVMAMIPNIVLWCAQSRDDGALVALNPSTGEIAWRLNSAAALFQAPRLEAIESATATERAEAAAITCVRAGPVSVLLRNIGEMIAVNNASGATQWTFASSMHAIDAADTTSQLVCVAGREAIAIDDLTNNPSLIQVLSCQTGAIITQRMLPEEWGRVRWLRILPDCVLVATDEVVAALELDANLPTRWVQQDRRYKDSPPAQIAGMWCLLLERAGSVAALNLSTGRSNPLPFVIPTDDPSSQANAITVLPYQNQWLAHRMHRIRLHATDGTLAGVDAVAVDHRYENVILGQNAVFVVDGARPEFFAEQGISSEILLREFRPSDGLRCIGTPMLVRNTVGRIAKSDAIDGWIFLGGDDKTIAISAPLSH